MPKPGPEHSWPDPAYSILLQLPDGNYTLERLLQGIFIKPEGERQK